MSRLNKETDYSEHQSFVMLETAKLLKKAGFSWKVLTYYQEGTLMIREEPHVLDNREIHGIIEEKDYNHFYELEDCKHWKRDREYFSCPTLAVAQRWLREVHHIFVEGGYIRRRDSFGTIVIRQKCTDERLGLSFEDGFLCEFSSYEEAVEYGITFVVETLLELGYGSGK